MNFFPGNYENKRTYSFACDEFHLFTAWNEFSTMTMSVFLTELKFVLC
jgi:hypothetical protein